LKELNQWIEKVSNEPSNEERQQYAAQPLYQHQYANYDGHAQDHPYETVECDFLLEHGRVG
jgi:hypothetical protein